MREQDRETQLAEKVIQANDPRLSIWTIRPEWIGWFYLLFALQAAPLIGTLWWSENQSGAHDNIASTITAVVGGSASLIFVAAIVSIIELEAAMVLRHLLIKREARKEREKAEQDRQAELERERAEETEQRIREAYEQGREDERVAQSASRDEAKHRNGNQEQ